MTRLIPAREAERLDALRRVAMGGNEKEPHFDAICRLACDVFKVPIATIAFVDADRQWCKASCGADVEEIPRDVAFCARTILFDAPLIVCDAAADRRFADNPLVAGAPGIRFYAGVPLALDHDLRIGTICLVDTAPRSFPAAQVRQLQRLAKIVVAFLRLQEATHKRACTIAEGRRLLEDLADAGDMPSDCSTHLAQIRAPLQEPDIALAT